MKKISLLILLALTITVGGVYAAWSYAENTVSVVTDTKTALGVTDAITSTAKGSIAISNMLPTLSINDNAPAGQDAKAPGDYMPEWDSAIQNGEQNNLTISFTTNSGAAGDEQGYIYILIAFVLQGDNSYNGNPIFTVTDENAGGELDAYIISDKNAVTADDIVFHYAIMKCRVVADGTAQTFTKKITPKHFIDQLTVNGSFTVPTLEDYENYSAAVESNKVYVVVTEIPTELANASDFVDHLVESDEYLAEQGVTPASN